MSYPNQEQAAILSHLDGTLLVLAPAGTGKTRLMADRLLHALAHGTVVVFDVETTRLSSTEDEVIDLDFDLDAALFPGARQLVSLTRYYCQKKNAGDFKRKTPETSKAKPATSSAVCVKATRAMPDLPKSVASTGR